MEGPEETGRLWMNMARERFGLEGPFTVTYPEVCDRDIRDKGIAALREQLAPERLEE